MKFWSWPKDMKARLTPERDAIFAIGYTGVDGSFQNFNVIPRARATFLFFFAHKLYEGMPVQDALAETLAAMKPKAVENLLSDLRPSGPGPGEGEGVANG